MLTVYILDVEGSNFFTPQTKKGQLLLAFFRLIGSGGWIRTNDLRVMSPTSYQTAPPRIKLVVNRTAPINVERMIMIFRLFANLFLKKFRCGADLTP